MKQQAFLLICLCFLCCYGNRVYAQKNKPAVFALNGNTLSANKARIKNSDPWLLPAYKQLIKDADKGLQYGPVSVMEKKNLPPSGNRHDYMSLAPYFWPDPAKPDGLPYIRRDGQTNPEVNDYTDKEYMPKLCDVVHTLALAWYFSEDKLYAQHAAQLLRVWFLDTATRMNPNLDFAQAIKGVNTGRGAGLIDSRHFIKVVDAAQILKHSGYWKENDQKGLQQWFSDFLDWTQTSPNGLDELDAPNNHGAWYDAQRLSMALYTGNTELAKKIAMNAAGRLDKQMDADGKFPKELERTISLHYSVFVMDAFFTIAAMAEKAGIDLWTLTTPSGKSLKKGFDALRPYLAKEKEWEGQQIKEFDYEEGFFLLMEGSVRFGCKKCPATMKSMAGDKGERMRINLLY
jgi:hypothetical protein